MISCVYVYISVGDISSLHQMLTTLSDPSHSSDISNWDNAGSVSYPPTLAMLLKKTHPFKSLDVKYPWF